MKKVALLGLAAALSVCVSAQAMTTYGPTQPGDTLWKLSRHHPAGVGRFQMMEAIQNLNPMAFRGEHETVLRTGVTLQVPTTRAEVLANQNMTPPANSGSGTSSSNNATPTGTSSASGTNGNTATPAPAGASTNTNVAPSGTQPQNNATGSNATGAGVSTVNMTPVTNTASSVTMS